MSTTKLKNMLLYGNKEIGSMSNWWRYQKSYHSMANFKARLRRHWFLIVWFALIAILDCISTEIGLNLGFTEKNTLQQLIQACSPLFSSGLELVGYSLLATFFIYTGSIKLGYAISLFAYTLGPAFNTALILLVHSGRVVPY